MSRWFDPHKVNTYSHDWGPLGSQFADDLGFPDPGWTVIANGSGQAATGSGTANSVGVRCATAATVKIVIVRANGGNYDRVGQSELWNAPAGYSTRDLTSPINYQSGDKVGIYSTSGLLGVRSNSGSHYLRVNADLSATGNSLSNIADADANVEVLVATGTGFPSVHWGGVPASAFTDAQGLGNGGGSLGRTVLCGTVTKRMMQDGTLETAIINVKAVGSALQWRVVVFRPNSGTPAHLDFVGESELFTPAGTGVQTVTLGTPIAGVQPGDLYGAWLGPTGSPQIGITGNSSTAGILYFEDHNTGTNQTFSALDNFYMEIEAKGGNPFLGISGDSLSIGHADDATLDWRGYEDGTGPFGHLAHDPGHAMRALVDPTFSYQNFGKGQQTWNWVNTNGLPDLLATVPTAIWLHCIGNDVVAGRTWNQIKVDMDAIYAQIFSWQHIFITEGLPHSGLTDYQSSGVPADDDSAISITAFNAKLATWVSGKSQVTRVVCHDIFGVTRPSTGNLDDLNPTYKNTGGNHLTQAGNDELALLVTNAMEAWYVEATAAVTASAATCAATATFTVGAFHAIAAVTTTNATCTGTATYSPGIHTAAAAVTTSHATGAGTATYSPGTHTGTVSITTGQATCSASATFRSNNTGTLGVSVSRAVAAVSATFVSGVTGQTLVGRWANVIDFRSSNERIDFDEQ